MIWCKGQYAIGTVTSDYYFVSLEENIPHRRKVQWNPDLIDREQFSDALKQGGAVCNISKYAEELENFFSPKPFSKSKTSDEFVLVMVPLWVPTGMRN